MTTYTSYATKLKKEGQGSIVSSVRPPIMQLPPEPSVNVACVTTELAQGDSIRNFRSRQTLRGLLTTFARYFFSKTDAKTDAFEFVCRSRATCVSWRQ